MALNSTINTNLNMDKKRRTRVGAAFAFQEELGKEA
jgi:hypothetical protein